VLEALGGTMKYMIEYEIRTAGLSYEQNLANQEALIKAFGKWTPEDGLTVHAFLSNLATGGYVLVEADDPKVVQAFVGKFVYWNEITVVPVTEVADGVASGNAAIAWARGALAG
jgi:Domain of unknown function (DUF3303)